MPGPEKQVDILRSKRDATQYQILVQIAQHQPAISQQEIADAIGLTSQAVSNYLQDLIEEGFVSKRRRGRYEVTKEGVNWLITQTDELDALVEYVSSDVIGQVDVEAAIAVEDIDENQQVSLEMRDGLLHAMSGTGDGATAVAVTDAVAGEDVGVSDFEGVLEYEFGTVTVISVPGVREGGSRAVDREVVTESIGTVSLVAAAGVEAIAAARAADVAIDLRFGTPEAVCEAAMKGLDVAVITVADQLSAHTDRLRELNIGYEVVDAR